MRMIVRTSKWSIWARRFASLALPLSILPVWMHRNMWLDSDAFQVVFALAMLLAILAIAFGIAAYFRVWQTGDHGWGQASFGLFVGLLCIAPIVYGAVKGINYPVINDVSTNLHDPLSLVVKTGSNANPDVEFTDTFPEVLTRKYSVAPTEIFELVEELVSAHEWDVRVRRRPSFGGRPGQVNALAMTFMGWRDEVAIRVMQTNQGSQVDMRSTSLNGLGDLGTNGKRIEQFLLELDVAVAEALANL